MFSRLTKFALAGAAALAIGGTTTAFADNHEDPCAGAEDPCAGATDPCAGAEDPCAGATDPCAGATDPCAGGDMGGDTGGDTGADPMGVEEAAGEGIVLGAGRLAINARIEANLASDQVFKPFSIAPDVHYGVMPDLTVSLYHSGWGKTGFLGAGNGICPAGEDNGCAKIYDNVGIGGVYRFIKGPLELGGHVQIHVNSFDPLLLAARVGVKGQYTMGKIAIGFDPYVAIGLTERDAGNKEVIGVPVSVSFAATPQLNAFLMTGITGPLDGFADNLFLPVGLGAQFNINANMAAGAAFQFNAVQKFAGASLDIFDNRILNLFFNYSM